MVIWKISPSFSYHSGSMADSSKWPGCDADESGLFHGQKVYNEPPMPKVIPTKEQLAKLTEAQYAVTQERCTERRYKGKYLNITEDGIFSCLVCGLSLFKTEKKFDSGCGWLSFSDVVDPNYVVRIRDTDLPERVKMEIACSKCGAHLGHVFEDGPKDDTGLRYCINSLAVDFRGDK